MKTDEKKIIALNFLKEIIDDKYASYEDIEDILTLCKEINSTLQYGKNEYPSWDKDKGD
jgi:hypothetical protein